MALSEALPVLISIQVGLPRQLGTFGSDHPLEKPWTSGFCKEPVLSPVRAHATGLEGDGQADLENHGGRDKAILAYSARHYAVWYTELSALEFTTPQLPHGAFGENFTVSDLDETTVCIGDTWQVGEIQVQISQPRQPCWKLARRWQLKQLPALVVQNGRCGWYLRVLKSGMVQAGDRWQLVERPAAEWTVWAAHQVMHHRRQDRQAAAALADCTYLADSWRGHLAGRAAGAQQ